MNEQPTQPTPIEVAMNLELTKLSRHPFQLLVMGAGIVSGLPIFLGRIAGPNSLEAKLPPAGVLLWALLFAGGGLLAIIGAFMRRRMAGLLVEQVGLGFVGSACLLYGGLLWVNVGWQQGSVSIALLGLITVAAVWRFVDIQRTIRSVKKAAQKVTERSGG